MLPVVAPTLVAIVIAHVPAVSVPLVFCARVQVPPATASALPAAVAHAVVDGTILIAATSVAALIRLVVTNSTVVATLAGRVVVVVDATVAVDETAAALTTRSAFGVVRSA